MACWTRRIRPFILRWIERPPGALVTYRLGQALTDYEAYNGNHDRFGIAPHDLRMSLLARLEYRS